MATLAYQADPFAALGLTRDASPRAIKARYYQLARKYHPNTNHGVENSPTIHSPKKHHFVDTAVTALSEHFHRIYDAYTLLSKDSHRKRYIELAALEELELAVEAHRHELEYIDYGDSGSDGWSSDLDDFEVAHYHRSMRGRSPSHDGSSKQHKHVNGHHRHNSSDSESRGRVSSRRRSSAVPDHMNPDEHRADSAQRAAAERRKKLNRIKRKEVAVFEAYRSAKIDELAAQIEAERLKDIYERTKAKREQIEKIPLEVSTRVKMVRNILMATKLLRPTPRLGGQGKKLTLNTTSSMLNEEIVNITSPQSARPGVPLHRRGFSSDISGDQTDSDEETPHAGHFRHPFRSPTPTGRPSVSRDRSPAPSHVPAPPLINLPQHRQPSVADALGVSFDMPHHHVPLEDHLEDSRFKLFVKRPTGFDEQEIVEDLTSPVSPSPIVNHCRELIHLPLGVGLDDQAEAGAENGTATHQPSDSDSEASPVRQAMFQVKLVNELRFPVHIPCDHVHRLNLREERRLLGKPLDADTAPKDLLRQLSVWDPVLSQRFMVKPDIKAAFAFRLVCNNRELVSQTHHSFIALSYRRKKMVRRENGNYTLPLSREMFQAVWEERATEEEGLWIDQISINQDDDRERDISMSAMDLVYRSARLIVVVLDDFEFEPHERGP
ncbi:hypothetical protein AMS68_002571 [Peltaster fructicola]|uniref:J domain-containing protein n=1 Tax=Peltaster fructicola TaxID=286661 RepID=A0A6H0XQP7_9PEZI|nr:hypothetical protein AMS68_002571 [Peltaster fructicola]